MLAVSMKLLPSSTQCSTIPRGSWLVSRFAECHGAEAEPGNVQIGVLEFSIVHSRSLSVQQWRVKEHHGKPAISLEQPLPWLVTQRPALFVEQSLHRSADKTCRSYRKVGQRRLSPTT